MAAIKRIIQIAIMTVAVTTVYAQRTENDLKWWEFSRDSINWQRVSVPHDWAISGPFDKKWDMQSVAIFQNGETVATEKTGRTGALPWIGRGYYRTTMEIPEGYSKVMLCFDGAMSEPKVRVNGEYAGGWNYGYNAFRLDITEFVKTGTNSIQVDLENLPSSSRWYPGAGLYRPVTLVLTQTSHLDPWQTAIRTHSIEGVNAHATTATHADIYYETVVQGAVDGLSCNIEILDSKGNLAAEQRMEIPQDGKLSTQFTLYDAQLWSPENPYLYKVRQTLVSGGRTIDTKVTTLGVRTVSITQENGFQLNGVARKLQGVCLHHDLGPLGAAVNRAALARQIKIMKDMGADAIRTSHNMPSKMQIEVCDSLGMMVMAESFDTWIYPKVTNGYSRFFREWAEKDIENLVRNHRNHPSIIMWSIGNEIPEQTDRRLGVEWSKKLQDLCHALDPTRTVTQGFDRVDQALQSGVAAAMDVVGLNYRTFVYERAFKQSPHGVILGSETASTISSRGVYKLPYEIRKMAMYPDAQCSSYDNEFCSWSNLPETDFALMDDLPWTIGQFVWTGIDYLGEPTPYDDYWPSRSSYFGICDLAGLPKDRYYLYRSQWNKSEHTLHIAPHWNWGDDMVGQIVPIQVYTDYPEAELFINGKSQGRIRKQTTPVAGPIGGQDNPPLDRYRLRWMETRYEPGELKVVAYDSNGRKAMKKRVRTAGEPARLLLISDCKQLSANGDDLAYITVTMTDKNGNICPLAHDQLEFTVEGSGTFRAVCNGDATSTESFTEPTMKLFNGQLVVTVQSARLERGKGKLTLKVRRPAQVSQEGRKSMTIAPLIESKITIDVL